MCQKKGAEETTKESSEKSEKLEDKDQGECKVGRLFAAREK